eukprot:929230_1
MDVRLLRQIIEIYADSIVSQLPKQREPLSAAKSLKQWKEPKQNEDGFKLSADDATILKLLKKHCPNKRASMYQRQSKLLISVPMEILSYSFSFLSFRELSVIQRVCLYFMNSSTKYSNLSHYHLNIDRRFATNAMSNQLNLNLLTHFKSICVTYAPKTVIASMYLIQMITKQNQTSLQTLTVDYRGIAAGGTGGVVLNHILNTSPSFPALHTICWRRRDNDSRTKHDRSYWWTFSRWQCRIRKLEYSALAKVMRQRVPHLHHLELKTKSYDMEGSILSLVDCTTLHSLHLSNHALLS